MASPDLYSTCSQLILVAWLVIAVETRTFRAMLEMPVRKLVLGYALVALLAGLVTVALCLFALAGAPLPRWVDVVVVPITAATITLAFVCLWWALVRPDLGKE